MKDEKESGVSGSSFILHPSSFILFLGLLRNAIVILVSALVGDDQLGQETDRHHLRPSNSAATE